MGPYASGQHTFYVSVSCQINGVNGFDSDGAYPVTVAGRSVWGPAPGLHSAVDGHCFRP